MLFDTHAHYDDERFDPDREELLVSLPDKGVDLVINVGYDMPSSENSVAFAEKYLYIYAAVGVHPHDAKTLTEGDCARLLELSRHPRVVAIGEIGLDYHYDLSPRDVQRTAFARQIELAKDAGLPFIVHEREACKDCLDILKSQGIGERAGVMHCFSGSRETAKILLDMGMYISVGGPVTFKNNVKTVDMVDYVPLDRLFIETDSPYMAPVPHRGKRNDSSLVIHVAEKIAQIKGLSVEEVAAVTKENAKKFFNIV